MKSRRFGGSAPPDHLPVVAYFEFLFLAWGINRLKTPPPTAAPAAPPADVALLTEIRDLLKK